MLATPPPLSDKARAEVISGAGTKDDGGKPRMSLLPGNVLVSVALVFTYGAKKYNDFNWRRGMKWRRMYDAAERHMTAWLEGQDNDDESELPHLAHAICCLMMLLAWTLMPKLYKQNDDRWITMVPTIQSTQSPPAGHSQPARSNRGTPPTFPRRRCWSWFRSLVSR